MNAEVIPRSSRYLAIGFRKLKFFPEKFTKFNLSIPSDTRWDSDIIYYRNTVKCPTVENNLYRRCVFAPKILLELSLVGHEDPNLFDPRIKALYDGAR